MITTHSTQKLITTITQSLLQKYEDSSLATNYAWWMVEAITNQTKMQLLADNTIGLSSSQQQQLDVWIQKQVHDHMPLQYLLGTVPFGDCTIQVAPPILIPRSATEQWCMSLITQLQKVSQQPLHILDIGTGSGCIAIALARALPQATIWAVDISPQAIALAQKNARHNNVHNIRCIESDLFTRIPSDVRFDLIVSNPPYIGIDEQDTLDLSVRNWEDTQALFATENGIGILKKIITQAPTYLHPHSIVQTYNIPQLIVEIGYQQGALISSLFREAQFHDVHIAQDLQGHNRTVAGYRRHVVHTNT